MHTQIHVCIQTNKIHHVYLDSAQRHNLSTTSKNMWNSTREGIEPSDQPHDLEEKIHLSPLGCGQKTAEFSHSL